MPDPTKQIPYKFEPREYQLPFLYEVQQAIDGESDKRYFMQIWHRRSGKDKVDIADVMPKRLTKDPVLGKYVYPTLVMGRDNLWEGIGSDGFRYLDHFPEDIRADKPNQSRMTIPIRNSTDPNTSSIFQIAGTDNPDSLRGGNAKIYVFSEWSEHDPYAWDVVEPILKENDGIAIFNFTPKGDNHARAFYDYAKTSKKWWTQLLTVEDTKIYTREQIDEIRADIIKRWAANGRSESEATAYFEQEYMCSFKSPVIGSYFGAGIQVAEQQHRITAVPYDSRALVDTAWDLGVDDSTTIWFFQRIGLQIRIIDYYENSGEGLSHYASILKQKPYNYGEHWAPHDIQVRELGTGVSRLETAKGLGINFRVQPMLSVDEGIDAARSILSKCWFDEVKTFRGIQALKNYAKDWDEKNKTFKRHPKHDWSSHGADAFRGLAVVYKPIIETPSTPDWASRRPSWSR